MVRLIALLAAGTRLGGLRHRRQPEPVPVAAAVAEAAGGRSRRGRQGLQIGSFGFDAAGMDTSVAPGDDFYQYANGTWAQEHADPGRQVQLRHVHHARRSVARAHAHDLLEEPPRTIRTARSAPPTPASSTRPRSRRRAWRRSSRGSTQIRGARRPRPAMPALLAARRPQRHRHAVRRLRRPGRQDSPINMRLTMVQAGLGMPDRDYYLSSRRQARRDPRRLSRPSRQAC